MGTVDIAAFFHFPDLPYEGLAASQPHNLLGGYDHDKKPILK